MSDAEFRELIGKLGHAIEGLNPASSNGNGSSGPGSGGRVATSGGGGSRRLVPPYKVARVGRVNVQTVRSHVRKHKGSGIHRDGGRAFGRIWIEEWLALDWIRRWFYLRGEEFNGENLGADDPGGDRPRDLGEFGDLDDEEHGRKGDGGARS